MPAIQLRRGGNIGPNDAMYIGEPMWDDAKSRFGVFNNRSGQMEWYPIVIGDKLLLNQAQTLGGVNSAGAENPVYFDWATDGSIIMRNRTTSEVYATFAANGATFNAISSLGTSYIGLLNMVLNGNLAVKKRLNPITAINTDTPGYNSVLVAPNWHLWRKAGTGGRMVLSYDTSGSMPYLGCQNVFQINTSNALTNGGLRTFTHGAQALAGRPITVDTFIYGSLGAKTFHRAITKNGNTLYSEELTGTGEWMKISKTITPPVDGSDWILFDVLYNPSYNVTSNQTWKFGGIQVRPGTGTSDFENRPAPFEASLCATLYQEGKVFLQDGDDSEAVSFATGLAYDQRIETKEPNNATVAVTGMTAQGMVIRCPEISASTYVDYAAYVLPYTNDSTPA